VLFDSEFPPMVIKTAAASSLRSSVNTSLLISSRSQEHTIDDFEELLQNLFADLR